MGLRSKIREHLDREGSDASYWPAVAAEGEEFEPVADLVPSDQEEADTHLDHLEGSTTWLVDLSDALLGENDPDPTGADLASEEPPPVWLPNDGPSTLDSLPAGAVRNRDDVYPDGNRCAICHVPTLLDVCVGCATEPKS